ncbi:mycofactocin biosynthesis chaperone MftB [uncultured Amnibacterium sp.]|uniref:mycofactocin biosynthesis chaperone MftB n=1 Tax=uncultured Amnibacterium sp. TaxID=1631851 RepID=UPI0035CA3107
MPAEAFDLDRVWAVHPRVSIRPEPFGALVYHFETRKLSFLKERTLLDVVAGLDGVRSARAVCRGAGVAEADLLRYGRALGTLAASSMLVAVAPAEVAA